MKKLILASIAMVALTIASMAGTNDALLKNLKNAANSIKSAAVWSTTGNFKSASFSFSGKQVKVFYDAEGEDLIGFSVKIGLDELPAGTADNVQKKFNGWTITDKIMFIDDNGNSNYYVQVTKGDHNLALNVTENGKVHIYSQMP
jgi:hypothetical protein